MHDLKLPSLLKSDGACHSSSPPSFGSTLVHGQSIQCPHKSLSRHQGVGSDGKLAASAALEAIFKQQQRRHQITLSTTDAQGM